MTLAKAFKLCREGTRVRPARWASVNPSCWVEYRKHGEEGWFVECGEMQEMAHALRLGHEDDFFGPWELA